MTHTELCYKTAKRFLKEVALVEYKTVHCGEEPDVLCIEAYKSTLFEIKVSRQDFKKDANKKYRKAKCILTKYRDRKLIATDYSSLGMRRYYVCPKGVIKPEETGYWGLYYVSDKGRFTLIKESEFFKHDYGYEQLLLINALRKVCNSWDSTHILVRGG